MSFANANTIPRISAYIDRVQRVTDAGGTVTKAYDDAVNRWRDWAELGEDSPMQALTDAWEAGATIEALTPLRTTALLAMAASPQMSAEVRNTIAPIAHGDIVQAYQPNAKGNYERVRAAWQETADTLTAHAKTVDIEGDPGKLITATDTERTAWLDAGVAAARLDQLTAVLLDAAILAGAATDTDTHRLGLTIHAPGIHRRRVWEAWETQGRTGKWGALLVLGVKLEASALDKITAYREPKPLEMRQEKSGYGVRQYQHDPEDEFMKA